MVRHASEEDSYPVALRRQHVGRSALRAEGSSDSRFLASPQT
jgi:hypothetical protein